MKYHKLHIVGFTDTTGLRLQNYIGTILGKDGRPLYDLSTESLKDAEYEVSENVPLLAADAATVVPKNYDIVPYYTSGGKRARSFDLSFTIVDGDESRKVAFVRMNEPALLALREQIDNAIAQKLD